MERYINITYTSGIDHTRTVLYSFKDSYDENMSYRDNFHYLVAVLLDDGGFWVNDNTFVPYHMIVSFTVYYPNSTGSIQPQISAEPNSAGEKFRNKYRRDIRGKKYRRNKKEQGSNDKTIGTSNQV